MSLEDFHSLSNEYLTSEGFSKDQERRLELFVKNKMGKFDWALYEFIRNEQLGLSGKATPFELYAEEREKEWNSYKTTSSLRSDAVKQKAAEQKAAEQKAEEQKAPVAMLENSRFVALKETKSAPVLRSVTLVHVNKPTTPGICNCCGVFPANTKYPDIIKTGRCCNNCGPLGNHGDRCTQWMKK
jgi:hypothetical protein